MSTSSTSFFCWRPLKGVETSKVLVLIWLCNNTEFQPNESICWVELYVPIFRIGEHASKAKARWWNYVIFSSKSRFCLLLSEMKKYIKCTKLINKYFIAEISLRCQTDSGWCRGCDWCDTPNYILSDQQHIISSRGGDNLSKPPSSSAPVLLLSSLQQRSSNDDVMRQNVPVSATALSARGQQLLGNSTAGNRAAGNRRRPTYGFRLFIARNQGRLNL